MGIAPITNLIPLSQTRTVQGTFEPVPMERVENSARSGDETYTPNNGKSAGGSEEDSSEEEQDSFELASGEDSTDKSSAPDETRPISFFA
ncbi:MAG: hypothetical protein ABSG96_03170 [Terracidiphilus sp.]|jgi:hypothetical protein